MKLPSLSLFLFNQISGSGKTGFFTLSIVQNAIKDTESISRSNVPMF
jgi:superfamily II DNA/RNA helicase